ncbi:MAG: low molecular weight protein arginine phosphatase [Christensenellales bacterium]
MKTVLFVCSGNTCRSPMAEAIFNDALDDRPRLRALGARAISAGTFACEGADMAKNAELALESMGVKLPFFRHRAVPFTQEMADEADLILAMQEQHLEEIEALAPNAGNKASTLKGYANGKDGHTGSEEYDIEDPFRQPLEVYQAAAEEIRQLINKAMDRMESEWLGE